MFLFQETKLVQSPRQHKEVYTALNRGTGSFYINSSAHKIQQQKVIFKLMEEVAKCLSA